MNIELKRAGETAKFHLYSHADYGKYVLAVDAPSGETRLVLTAVDVYALALMLRHAERNLDA